MARQRATETETEPADTIRLDKPHYAVRKQLNAATALSDFLTTTNDLSLNQRRRLVRQARVLLKENFVHLPLKEAMHGINPVQKLLLLEHRLDQATSRNMGSEYNFHREMLEIFTSLRDLHTNYLLPASFARYIAFMPFSVEEYFENGRPRYIATHIVEGFTHEHFKQGVEITHWSGAPITRAIEVAANLHAGSNEAARHARGIDGLTLRSLKSSLPPNENWVIVGYNDLEGSAREVKQQWMVSEVVKNKTGQNADRLSEDAASLGLDIDADVQQQARKMLFAPQVVAAENRTRKRLQKRPVDAGKSLTSTMTGVFRARSIETNHGVFGYIRIYTFNVKKPIAFIKEFIRLIALLPKEGLIIDVRGNGGGHIQASEGLLQTLTPYAITPEPAQFINTPVNVAICKSHRLNPAGIDLSHWYESMRDAIATGAIYSRAYPITSKEFANRWGQQYHGPVVLITDARCYSATDIFAAGFQDHDIGCIIGVDNNTGAGGANVWTHKLLYNMCAYDEDDAAFYQGLPAGTGMRVSIRRTLRVGVRAGTPVEDIGVTPDHLHEMTKDDLLNGNVDLINRAAKELSEMPVRQLDIKTKVTGTTIKIDAITVGLDRLDIYVDERPMKSHDIDEGEPTSISFELPENSKQLTAAGYKAGDWVAARNIPLK